MKRGILVLFSLAAVMLPTLSTADDTIDVLLVFSDDIGLSTNEKASLAIQWQLHINNAFNRLDGSKTISLWPLIPAELPYKAAGKQSRDAIRWMEDENARLQSSMRLSREALGGPGSDLVLMVVPEFSNNACGSTDPVDGRKSPPTRVTIQNSESYAFAVVRLERNKRECRERFVVPHEIGHLLYAEHEFDTNGSVLPSPKNHATNSNSYGMESLMWSQVTSRASNYLSGSVSQLTDVDADNVQFISDESFEVVSRYRSPAPTLSYLQTGFLGCPPGCGYSPYRIEWSGSPGTQSYNVQVQYYGRWTNHYSGSGSSTIGTSNGTRSPGYYRVRAVNQYGVGDWVYVTLFVQCSKTQNPW